MSLDERITNHNDLYYDDKYTRLGIPGEEYWHYELSSMEMALKIERHIKAMKSGKYIENLNKHPEIIKKLISKYS